MNYFRDHVSKMTEMVKPPLELIDIRKYKRSKQLNWTEESKKAFRFCRVAVSNCQELFFLQTNSPDGCLRLWHWWFHVHGHQRTFPDNSICNWSAREKEYYGIYYGVRLFEDLSYFLLKTDQINLTYINVTFTDKVIRWKLTL